MPCIIICGRKKQQTNADRIIHAWLDGVHAPKTLLITHLHGVREREREWNYCRVKVLLTLFT